MEGEQRSLIAATGIETLEYPDLYRGHKLVTAKTQSTHKDRLGRFKALTWSCWVYGPEFHSLILALELPEAIEAIALAMVYLDYAKGDRDPKRNYYIEAVKRVSERLDIPMPRNL